MWGGIRITLSVHCLSALARTLIQQSGAIRCKSGANEDLHTQDFLVGGPGRCPNNVKITDNEAANSAAARLYLKSRVLSVSHGDLDQLEVDDDDASHDDASHRDWHHHRLKVGL